MLPIARGKKLRADVGCEMDGCTKKEVKENEAKELYL